MPWRPRGGLRYIYTRSLTSTLDGGGWSTPRSGRFISEKETSCPLYMRRLVGPRSQSGWVRKISHRGLSRPPATSRTAPWKVIRFRTFRAHIYDRNIRKPRCDSPVCYLCCAPLSDINPLSQAVRVCFGDLVLFIESRWLLFIAYNSISQLVWEQTFSWAQT